MKKIVLIAVLVLCMGLGFVQKGHAAFYKYIDKSGVVCFADNLQVVPEQYRASVVLVQNEQQEEIHPAATTENTTETAPAAVTQQSVSAPLSLDTRLTISSAIAIGALLFFLFVKNVPRLEQNRSMLIMIRGALIGAVSIYIIYAHAGDVLIMYGRASRAIEETQQKSAERGRKAGQFIKQMDAMAEDTKKLNQDLDRQAAEPQEGGR